jgi:hypothetical protein
LHKSSELIKIRVNITMSVVMIGDSNLRNMLEESRERLSTAVGEEIVFKMATSNESTKAHLESLDKMDQQPKIIIVLTPLNEVVKILQRSQGKGRDETLRSVIEEQNKIVHASAEKKPNTLHVLVPPFLRLEPSWIGTRLRLGVFYIKDFISNLSPWNIAVANPIEIKAEDIDGDKIHLNKDGKEKLYESLKSDVIKCKENLGEAIESQNMDWASQLSDNFEPPTPNTMRKRCRQREEESDEEDGGGKRAKLDTVLDKIDTLVREIKQERVKTKQELVGINTRINNNKETIQGVKKYVEEKLSAADVLTAEMREDIDGLENENLKQTVVVKKLKAEGAVPKEKRAFRACIQTIARALVKKVLDQNTVNKVRYAAPLFSFIDPSKKDNAVGLVPPFKIGFTTKDNAIRFREAAVKKSKEEGSDLKTTYFSFFQSAGTRVRVLLLWAVADNIRAEGREVWVTQNSAKPSLQVKENGKVIESLTFVKAMAKYGEKIPQKALAEATKIAKKSFSGNLKKTFIILKD